LCLTTYLFLVSHTQRGWHTSSTHRYNLFPVHNHFLTSLSACLFTCLADGYAVTFLMTLNNYVSPMKGKSDFQHWNNVLSYLTQTLLYTPSSCQMACPMRNDIFRQHTETVVAWNGVLFRICTLGAGRIETHLPAKGYIKKIIFFGSNWKEYCVFYDGFYLYKPTMIVFLTSCIPLYWRINRGILKTQKKKKKQYYKNNKFTNYMFRPRRSHLQADFCTILGSIQIMGGREISLRTVFVKILVFTYNLISRLHLKIKITRLISNRN